MKKMLIIFLVLVPVFFIGCEKKSTNSKAPDYLTEQQVKNEETVTNGAVLLQKSVSYDEFHKYAESNEYVCVAHDQTSGCSATTSHPVFLTIDIRKSGGDVRSVKIARRYFVGMSIYGNTLRLLAGVYQGCYGSLYPPNLWLYMIDLRDGSIIRTIETPSNNKNFVFYKDRVFLFSAGYAYCIQGEQQDFGARYLGWSYPDHDPEAVMYKVYKSPSKDNIVYLTFHLYELFEVTYEFDIFYFDLETLECRQIGSTGYVENFGIYSVGDRDIICSRFFDSKNYLMEDYISTGRSKSYFSVFGDYDFSVNSDGTYITANGKDIFTITEDQRIGLDGWFSLFGFGVKKFDGKLSEDEVFIKVVLFDKDYYLARTNLRLLLMDKNNEITSSIDIPYVSGESIKVDSTRNLVAIGDLIDEDEIFVCEIKK